MKLYGATILILLTAHCSFAATIHDESSSGDLSGAFEAPTQLSYQPGANTIIGQVGANGNSGATNDSDADYFTFALSPGQTLTSIGVDSYSFAPDDPGQSLLAYVDATAFEGQGFGDISANVLFNGSSGNLLDSLGGELGAGEYSFWVQETSPNTVDYSLTFNVQGVPEPNSPLPFAIGAASIFAWLRRRS